jgi:hypothetical protein
VPWCATCDRFLSPSSVTTDGTCPRCGREVDPGRAHAPPSEVDAGPPAPDPGAPEPTDDDLGPIPWHLKALAGAVALYLGYRAFQGIEWEVHRF